MSMNGNGRAPVNDYRRHLSSIATNAAYQFYQVNPHPQSALSLERLVFGTNVGTPTTKTGDLIRVSIMFSQSLATILAGQFELLGQAVWLVPGTAGTAVFAENPPGDIGLELSPALRLAPRDDPVFINFRNEGASGAGGGGSVPGDLYCIVSGWEIPTLDIGTFPAPANVEAIL